MRIRGFDTCKGSLDPSGGIFLESKEGADAAGWSFSALVSHWGRKHAAAAYVPYERGGNEMLQYRYNSPVLLGEGTNFAKFLRAMVTGDVVFDPGSKLDNASTPLSKIKARSQFRIARKKLSKLYDDFSQEQLV